MISYFTRIVPILLGLTLWQQAKTPPKTPPAEKDVLKVPVQAIVITDDDGTRPPHLTPEQVKTWIDAANADFAGAKVHFEFKPDDSDYATVPSTTFNNLSRISDAEWHDAKPLGNALADRSPDRITLIFRHGLSSVAATGGFAGLEYNFVVLPGFDDCLLCDHQNKHFLAQQIAAYLGLAPTFARTFDSAQQAEAFLRDHENKPSCFDGDGLTDTAPDPFVLITDTLCGPLDSLTLNQIEFQLPRRNLLSGYDSETKTLTPMQIARLNWTLKARLANRMKLPSNLADPKPVKADTLTITERRDCTESVKTVTAWNAATWNDGTYLRCEGKKNGAITLQFTVEEKGKYNLALYATQAPDFGIVQVSLDEKPLSKPLDWWAPFLTPSGKIPFDPVMLKAGEHKLKLEVTDKSKWSSNYYFGLDSVEIVPVEK